MLFFVQTSSAPNDILWPSDGQADVRAQLRQLFIALLRRDEFPLKPVVIGAQLRSVIFYKIHDPRESICIDRQPPQGTFVDTCDKQRDDGYCKARYFGIIQDGLCARTCGLCEIRNLGMRATFAFATAIESKIPVNGHRVPKVIVTLEMQPTGQWRYYNTRNYTMDVGVHCQANRFMSHAVDPQVRM